MKRGKLLNSELNNAIASMGHGDLMIVCDAGFPIPSDAWRIDLSITQDVPDLETVLSAIGDAFIAEKVSYAAEMADIVRTRHRGETVVIVSHSNTLPTIIGELGIEPVPFIADDEYDDLYIVFVAPRGKARLLSLRYGRETP